jgi:O-antigen/teichoic acid export membrane protein
VVKGPTQEIKTLQARILSGSFVLLSGSGLATAISFAYNIAVARFLGPIGYGHATAVYTLLTLISAITLSFQIVSAKMVAQQSSDGDKGAAYRDFHRGAWACGILVGLFLLLFQRTIADYLKLPTSSLVALLAVGAAFYVPLGSRRGFIQGAYGFRLLATNLVMEGAVRLGGSLLLISFGLGVEGVIVANSAAVAVAYLAAKPKLGFIAQNKLRLSDVLRETFQGIIFFAGQVLINNCDIVLVKHFFPPRSAGLYAAVAMVGRVIFAFSSAVVNTMFPIAAGTRDEERRSLRLLTTSLVLVLGIGSVVALGLRLAPADIWTRFFGSGFAIDGKYGLPYLLALYAITTVVYSLSVVIISYEMSYKIANTNWIQLAFSGVLIAGICRFHSSLREVILVQLVLMFVLFILVGLPFLINSLRSSNRVLAEDSPQPIRVVRRVSEDKVIAEFLKSDFENAAFREYHKALREIVANPDFEDVNENAQRRALLFIRHLALWKELPVTTEWYEVEVSEDGLDQIRAFPRAQWRKLARGNFSITEVADRIRRSDHALKGPFLSKIESISNQLHQENVELGSVILIGVSENDPVTILDGNHRLVAAMLASPHKIERLRFFCGLSPRMTECCWYNTNLVTLFRYGRNLLTHVVRDPEGDLVRLLESSS